MIHLYVKTHQITGLKYFGKTSNDPFRYRGSGKHWVRHIKAHGNKVDTVIVKSFNDDEKLLAEEFAVKYSIDNDIVNSKEWANLMIETTKDGLAKGTKFSDETRQKMSIAQMGNTATLGKILTEEHKQKIAKAQTGRKYSEEAKRKMSEKAKGRPPWNKGKKLKSTTID